MVYLGGLLCRVGGRCRPALLAPAESAHEKAPCALATPGLSWWVSRRQTGKLSTGNSFFYSALRSVYGRCGWFAYFVIKFL